jgi:hypothetical protein
MPSLRNAVVFCSHHEKTGVHLLLRNVFFSQRIQLVSQIHSGAGNSRMRIGKIAHNPCDCRFAFDGRGKQTFYVLHYEHRRTVTGNDPEIFQIKCVALIPHKIRATHHPRTPCERIGLTGWTSDKSPSTAVTDPLLDNSMNLLMGFRA